MYNSEMYNSTVKRWDNLYTSIFNGTAVVPMGYDSFTKNLRRQTGDRLKKIPLNALSNL
jgi:hypothetical protein